MCDQCCSGQTAPDVDQEDSWRTALEHGRSALRKGYRGRVGMYIPPLMETLGIAEVEHHARNNRMRAL
jgi:hypothetical protein